MNGKSAVAFLFGAAIGAVSAYFYTKQKYEQIIDEEIESVKAMYTKTEAEEPSDSTEIEPEGRPENVADEKTSYNKIASDYGHQETEVRSEPYPISPEEFGESDFSVTYTYYADGVVTDEMDIIVDDADEAIGTAFVAAFDDDDCEETYIRNEVRHCDYEIVRERARYADTHPVIMDGNYGG